MKKHIYLIPLIVGVLFSVLGVKTIIKAFDSRDWLNCEGTITHSEIITKTSRSNSGTTSTRYSPKIQYEYVVEENTYSSSNISFGGRNAGRDYVQQTVDYYHVGLIVEVYFNPENPTESALEPGVTSGTYMPLAMGLIFMGVGMFYYKTTNKSANQLIDPTWTTPDFEGKV